MFCTDRASMLYRFLVDPSGVALFCMLLGAFIGIVTYWVIERLARRK